jgi:hypothetical protein
MAHQFVEHEAVAVGEFALKGVKDFLTAGFQAAAGMGCT